MPDVANAQKFIKKLTAVENDYLRQIDGYRTQARRVMLEILDREGVTRQAVNQMRREVDSLKAQVTKLGRSTSKDVRRTVQNYTRKQIQLANRVGLANEGDIGSLVAKGTDNAKDGEETFMTSIPAWLNQLETSLQTTSAQLRISQASPEEVSARLLSERLADGRASVWAASGNAAALEETRDVWTYAVGLTGAYLLFFKQEEEFDYQKQWISTIDERTTDCCLRAHGQIQPMDEPFQLTGTPRYADEVQDPPGHWYCRASEALYHESFEQIGIPTEKMRDMAELELDARELTGRRIPISPSHATSRREGALPSG